MFNSEANEAEERILIAVVFDVGLVPGTRLHQRSLKPPAAALASLLDLKQARLTQDYLEPAVGRGPPTQERWQAPWSFATRQRAHSLVIIIT